MTQLTNEHRSQITDLINVYLDGITSISADAGWTGDSLMSKIIEFGGDIPRGTGNDISNLSMINAMNMLRDQSPGFGKIQSIVQVLRSDNGTKDKINALLAKHYYRGLNEETDKVYTNTDRMTLMGQDIKDPKTADSRFSYDIRCAYRLVLRELERFDVYSVHQQ